MYWVGRRSELEWLEARFERVRRGERQIVFFTGEAGIGKTTLSICFWLAPTARIWGCYAPDASNSAARERRLCL